MYIGKCVLIRCVSEAFFIVKYRRREADVIVRLGNPGYTVDHCEMFYLPAYGPLEVNEICQFHSSQF